MSQQCPESASAIEPEDNAALNLLESYGALRTPNFDVVTSLHIRKPACRPTNLFVSPPFSWVPQSPGIEAINQTALAEKELVLNSAFEAFSIETTWSHIPDINANFAVFAILEQLMRA
ncbi:unnamed protein product [Clonostachys chloroleuca]|uniref:Uncharacterized protein n=1 Tax=Clonostachys chloroleuca TaxID=1926264 RepID=A0AA35M8H9_9HYPO|nr:unnamed protein product [Clonostachys chloroleuca]